jgi:cysteine desulfurase/selenocysteine lyase
MTLTAPTRFNVAAIRSQFPLLGRQVHGKPLVYLDNAATTQKPASVIERLERYYRLENANIHRGLHLLSEEATAAYEQTRIDLARHLNAADTSEVIFTRGTTDSINLVAQSYGRSTLKAGDEVLITWMEHHSNIVPWQMVCEQTGATLKVVPIDDRGELDMAAMAKLLTERVKIVSLVHVSNALGTINPVGRIVEMAHRVGAVVVVDGAQAVAHMPVDVRALGCDFYGISGHKMFGPTGTGALWGRRELLEAMPPYQGGGDMIRSVTFEKTQYNDLPYKFEAGTPHIAGVIGLGAALEFMRSVDWEQAAEHEADLLAYGTAALQEIKGLRLIGTAEHKSGVLSFVIAGQHPYELGQILDHQGVAVRTGHHCAQPVMDRFGVPATVRASLALYNVREEIDVLVRGLHKAGAMLG